jgi:K+-sensing histidine kinase KdpD
MGGCTYKIQKNDKKINIQCTVFKTKNAKYGLISISDVSKLKKYEQQRVADIFKTIYLQSIAHDLRTPLNVIMSMCEHIMNYYRYEVRVHSSMKVCVY